MSHPPAAAAAGSRRPASPSSVPPPAARRGHRAESPHEPPRPDAPLRRLNQDCVDIIVEYAACSVDAVLQLRRVNRGMATGLVNLFVLLYRDHPGRFGGEVVAGLSPGHTAAPLVAYIERCAAPELTGRHVFLAALYCCAPSAADHSTIDFRGELHFPNGNDRSADTLVRSLVSRFPRITRLSCARHRSGWRMMPHGLGDVGLTAVADKCPRLSSLEVTCVPGTAVASLLAVARKYPQLRVFGLYASPEMASASTLAAVGTACPELSTLMVSDSVHRKVNLAPAARCFPNLTDLDLTFNRAPSFAELVVAVAQSCPRLARLNVCNSAVTTAGLSSIARMCPRLECLDAAATDAAVSNGVLRLLAEHCPRLADISMIVATSGIDVDSIAALVEGCTQLRTLTAGGIQSLTATVTDADVARLQRMRPGCAFTLRGFSVEPQLPVAES